MAKKRILIIEDNMDTYELERFILEKSGFIGNWRGTSPYLVVAVRQTAILSHICYPTTAIPREPKSGYETFLAVNGRDGVNAVRKQNPDLIIMDLSMPEMDGWTATSLIKKDEQIANIPVIVVTAHALPSDRQRAMDAGCNEYVTKPMDLLDLVDTVNQWVSRGI